MVKTRIDGYSTAVVMASREDVSAFLTESLTEEAEFYNRIIGVMKSKGIYERPPYIPIPEKVDFVTGKNFFRGYLGKQRPLTSIEVSHVFSGLERNALRKSLFAGLANVAKSDQVRKYMERGMEISTKHIKIFSSILIKNDLPVSMNWDSGVVESKISPFSDRIIMSIVGTSNVELFSTYGKSLSVVGLPELGIDFMRLMAEIMKYAKDGVDITIRLGGFEEPPQVKGKETIDKKLH